ncbi:MAG: hypothetical protein NTU90_05265 [Proteobacteria bacterium]|jgi:hypothetical protein|nr:hypothetical protein [Pseudomonadota bacterium]
MGFYTGKKGIALVTVLAIVTISSAMIMIALYFITKGTEISGMQKRYQVALEASQGAGEVFIKEIIPTTITGASLSGVLSTFSTGSSAQITQVVTDACFSDKLLKSTTNWASGCNSSLDSKAFSDIKFTLSGVAPAQPFDIYTKIVDTVSGNSSTTGTVLEGMGASESASGMITPQHFPYTYRVEIQGERQNNPSERANLSVLYAY